MPSATSYVALLQGVNVGKRKVPMNDLRAVVAETGASDVATYVQSGNVVFRSSDGAAKVIDDLESRLAEAFGFTIDVILRTKSDMAKVVEANPWPKLTADPTKLVVTFYKDKPERAALDAVDLSSFSPEQFQLKGRELYLDLPFGQGRSKLVAVVARAKVGTPQTARNWRSVVTLAEMAAAL